MDSFLNIKPITDQINKGLRRKQINVWDNSEVPLRAVFGKDKNRNYVILWQCDHLWDNGFCEYCDTRERI